MSNADEVKFMGREKEGIVNFFSEPHGFGYIDLKGTKESIYVNIAHLVDTINENDKVVFDVIKGVKGLIATKVRLIGLSRI